MKDATTLEAKRYLATVFPEWKAFWFNKGPIARNMKELAAVLPGVPSVMYNYHVSGSKNDLAAWVKDVLGDAELAKELKGAKTAKDAADLVNKRLKQLDKVLVISVPAKKKK